MTLPAQHAVSSASTPRVWYMVFVAHSSIFVHDGQMMKLARGGYAH